MVRDTACNFFSSAARVAECIRRPTFVSLDIDVTVDDLKVLTKPFAHTAETEALGPLPSARKPLRPQFSLSV